MQGLTIQSIPLQPDLAFLDTATQNETSIEKTFAIKLFRYADVTAHTEVSTINILLNIIFFYKAEQE